jgi:hypothetical protein
MPHLVRRNVNRLVGSSSQALMLADDLAFRSSDGGRSWQPVDLVLDTAIAYKGALVAVGPGAALRSTDGGLTWLSLQTPAFEFGVLGIGPDLRLWWLHWDAAKTEALVSDDGIRWQAATSDAGVQDAVRRQLYRTPPFRSLIQEHGKPMKACLGTQCTDVGDPGWAGLWRVHGTDEVLAWMPDGTAGISTDGLEWQRFGGADRWYTGGLLRTGQGRLLGLNGNALSLSDDNGRNWQPVSTAPAEEWQATGASQLRRTVGRDELSTDGGQQWRTIPGSTTPEPGARAPDGSRLRIKAITPNQAGPIEFSADGGQTWSTITLANDVRSIAWLGDRWGAITNADQLHVSRDGRQWTAAGKVPSFSTESSFTGANGIWVVGWRRYPTLFPHALFESTDEGRTWTEIFPMAYVGESAPRYAFSCGGVLFGTGHEFAVRKPEGWKSLPPSSCMHDLLVTRDGSRVSADHGDTWTPLPKGRARTSTVFDGSDWWSHGSASLTLWPRTQPQ